MPLVESRFQPAWWLPGPHAQTLWAGLCRVKPALTLRRERLDLPDGDFLDIDWTPGGGHGDRPLVVVLHGLEGSSESGYVRGLLRAALGRGWRGAVLHFRGCSGEPNRLRRGYNAGETSDLDWFIRHLNKRQPETPLACVGYSLGGNVLLKWLGERGQQAGVKAAVAVSVPFLLETGAKRMRRGFSRIYQRYLLGSMRASYRRKFQYRDDALVAPAELDQLRDFYRFDDLITAPLHGYRGVDDYYARASSRSFLSAIRRPTLILHALDDPFFLPQAVPGADELSDSVTLELSTRGGHVGFVEGRLPGVGRYWLERRIPAFLSHYLSG